jgi:hypothetical protein
MMGEVLTASMAINNKNMIFRFSLAAPLPQTEVFPGLT